MPLPSLFERRSTTNLLLVFLAVVVAANGLHDGAGGLDRAVLTFALLGGLLTIAMALFLAVVTGTGPTAAPAGDSAE